MTLLTGSSLGGSSQLIIISNNIFASTWNTSNISTGSSGANQISLPLVPTGTYDFNVDWGDGSDDNITTWDQPEATHTYSSSGSYVLRKKGVINGWQFNNTGDRLKFISVQDFGALTIINSASINAFQGCGNMTSWAGVPNTEGVTNFTQFLRQCSSFNSPLESLNTSSGTNFNGFLRDSTSFNQPLVNLDTSSGTNLRFFLQGTTAFNNSLPSDVSSATLLTSFISASVSLDSSFYDDALNAWSALTLQSGVTLDMGTNTYTSAGSAARSSIISTYGWTINDGGQV